MSPRTTPTATATQNACKLCEPLGACLVFRGIEGAIPFLHGSQGCATYIRRYLIGHFREPMDIASSSFDEESAIFGGKTNLHRGLKNVIDQYQPSVIGIASTCLSETIGDDVPMMIRQFQKEMGDTELPLIISASTPSYRGTHMEGFHEATRSVVENLCSEKSEDGDFINLFPGIFSPADLRYLKEVLRDYGMTAAMMPDYSDTLDGPALAEYTPIPDGGTPIDTIRQMPNARASIAFGPTVAEGRRGSAFLQSRFGVEEMLLDYPMGIEATDAFFEKLSAISGRPMPEYHARERGRLIDSYVDGHKYLFGRRAVVYGEEDLVIGMAAFLGEIGVLPVLCASGGKSGKMEATIARILPDKMQHIKVLQGVDFADIGEEARLAQADLLLGGSKGYTIAREMQIPLIRVGFPIHDRIGSQRVLHIGYRGAQQLFDRLVNTLLEIKQEASPVGYLNY